MDCVEGRDPSHDNPHLELNSWERPKRPSPGDGGGNRVLKHSAAGGRSASRGLVGTRKRESIFEKEWQRPLFY